MTRRLTEPDFLKGICIILMVYGHVTYIGGLVKVQQSINGFIYTFHMPILLMVSGFFFDYTGQFAKRLERIFRRICVPYICFITLYLIGLILVQKIGIQTSNKPPASSLSFIKTIFINPIGGYWFLHSLIIVQFVVLLMNKIFINTRNDGEILNTLVCSLVSFVFLAHTGLVEIYISIYFLIGLLIGVVSNREISVPLFPTIIVTALVLMLSKSESSGIYEKLSMFQVAWCIVLFLLLWAFAKLFQDSFFVKMFAWIGRNSLLILVLHALFLVAAKSVNRIFQFIDSTGLLHSIMVTSLTVALCIVSGHVFDKLKISNYLFGVENIYSK